MTTRADPAIRRLQVTPSTPISPANHIATALRRQVPQAVAAEQAAGRAVTALDLQSFYARSGDMPRWVDRDGRPSGSSAEALSLLGSATAEGLDPADYSVPSLHRRFHALSNGQAPAPQEAAAFDVEISAAVLGYCRDLYGGRVDPHSIGFSVGQRRDARDFAAELDMALRSGVVSRLPQVLAPALRQYGFLKRALAIYRSLGEDDDIRAIGSMSRPIRPGAYSDQLPRLVRRLITLGDLRADVRVEDPHVYDGALVTAVQHFQHRHGLETDGIIGTATLAALEVPPAARIRQIELAMERLRWLPDLGGERLIALNIPMYSLWTWDDSGAGAQALEMRAIVGRAARTQTPILMAEMREVVFRPYWNVPPSILRGELLPLLSRDPEYLSRHHYEVVRGDGDDAVAVELTPASLGDLRAGRLRLRQRPGDWNALGLAKFVFPNSANVYLHGTPTQGLFARARRDFSHGCVRVEDAAALAAWVLKDHSEWTRARVDAAMAAPVSESVRLSRPIRVVLFYLTALVDYDDGAIHFADDIYGHDARLERALAYRQLIAAGTRTLSMSPAPGDWHTY